LKTKPNDKLSGTTDLYVVVCSATDTSCNTLPAKQQSTTGGNPAPPSTDNNNSALPIIVSWILMICSFCFF